MSNEPEASPEALAAALSLVRDLGWAANAGRRTINAIGVAFDKFAAEQMADEDTIEADALALKERFGVAIEVAPVPLPMWLTPFRHADDCASHEGGECACRG